MAHIKDKKISILKVTYQEDPEYGGQTEVWNPLSGAENIWAYFRHVSGSEFYAAKMVNSKEEVVFEINWRNDIDTTMRVDFKGKQYSITRIDNYEGYKADLKIYAYVING